MHLKFLHISLSPSPSLSLSLSLFFLMIGGSSEPPKKKRRSRWGSEQVKTVIPGLPTSLPANMKEDEQKLYISKDIGKL